MRSISVRELHDLMASGGTIDLIDVRTGMEYHGGHAVGARHVALGSLDPAKVMAARAGAQDDPLYIICASGGRSAAACDAFQRAGFSQVVNVEGGTGAWSRAGLPMERDAKAASMGLMKQIGLLALVAGVVLFLMPCSPFSLWGGAYCPTTPGQTAAAAPAVPAASSLDFQRDVVAASAQAPVLVDFHAGWCGPCTAMGPEIEALVHERGERLRLVKVDVDAHPQLAQTHGVQSIPDVRLWVGGREAARFVGYKDRAGIAAWVDAAVQR
ncbi:MAG: hypothetical protein J0M02_15560 [Planctomycetes bacterium]|nr:hypothetical protein [Planctomycetota bacterium]